MTATTPATDARTAAFRAWLRRLLAAPPRPQPQESDQSPPEGRDGS